MTTITLKHRKIWTSVTQNDVQQVKNIHDIQKNVEDIAKDVISAASTVHKIIQRLDIRNNDVTKVVESFLKTNRKF